MTAKRILLVDDEPNVVKSCARMLELEGFAVEGVTDGKEALDLYRRESFDLVLTDLKMPDVDGLEVLTTVKRLNPNAAVVIFTAYGTKESVVEALRLGAREFLEKPLDTKTLIATVRRILDQENDTAVQGDLRTMSLASIFQINCTELNQAHLRVRYGGQRPRSPRVPVSHHGRARLDPGRARAPRSLLPPRDQPRHRADDTASIMKKGHRRKTLRISATSSARLCVTTTRAVT